MKTFSNQNIHDNIDNFLLNRLSTLPKGKNSQLQTISDRRNSLNLNTQDTLKQNKLISKNNKAIQHIVNTQQIDNKKGILKNENNLNSNKDHSNKNISSFYKGQTDQQYTVEEIQAFNASIPIRGSYKENNTQSSLAPSKYLEPLRDEQKKQKKRVNINLDNINVNKDENQMNSNRVNQEKEIDKRKSVVGDLSKRNTANNNQTDTEKQNRIDGQIKRYMQKVGLQKKDKFPVFYTLDENGNEVKTSLSNPKIYAKYTKQQQPYIIQMQQQQYQANSNKNYLNDTKPKKQLSNADNSDEKQSNQNENLTDIMKICSEFQKTIVNLDKKNNKNAKQNVNDFRKLNNQLKLIDIQNIIIQESEDPTFKPYIESLRESGRLREPKIKGFLDS